MPTAANDSIVVAGLRLPLSMEMTILPRELIRRFEAWLRAYMAGDA